MFSGFSETRQAILFNLIERQDFERKTISQCDKLILTCHEIYLATYLRSDWYTDQHDVGNIKTLEEARSPQDQCPARCLFPLSRRDREFTSLNLVFRDENENFLLSVLCFETKTQIPTQSQALRRDQEVLSFYQLFLSFLV